MVSNENIHNLFKKIGKTVLDISYLGKGEASTVYKIITNDGVYAFKTALYPKRMKKVLQEAEFRKFFIEKGMDFIPPPVITDNEFFPFGAVIYEFVEGKKPDFSDMEVIKQFALILSKIHKIDYAIDNGEAITFNHVFSTMERIIKMISTRYPHLMNEKITAALELALKEFKENLSHENIKRDSIIINSQLHGDLSNNFVIDSNNKVWLIDWENSEYGSIAEEICWFLQVNNISPTGQKIFYQEYQKHFPEAMEIDFENIYSFYFAANLVYNIVWGIDFLAINLQQNLEPERKLRDLEISALEWDQFYSKEATNLVIEGIKTLANSVKG